MAAGLILSAELNVVIDRSLQLSLDRSQYRSLQLTECIHVYLWMQPTCMYVCLPADGRPTCLSVCLSVNMTTGRSFGLSVNQHAGRTTGWPAGRSNNRQAPSARAGLFTHARACARVRVRARTHTSIIQAAATHAARLKNTAKIQQKYSKIQQICSKNTAKYSKIKQHTAKVQ